MKKNIEKKETIINDTQKLISKTNLVAVVNYSGIMSIDLKEIRKNLKEKKVYIKVIKNTLIKIALKNLNNNKLIEKISGQKLFLFSNEIKFLVKFLQKINEVNTKLNFTYLSLYGKVYSKDNYYELNGIGTKEELITKFLFILKTPVIIFINNLKYNYIKLILFLKIIEKMRGEKKCL